MRGNHLLKKQTKIYLEKANIYPLKRLGQNFLTDDKTIKRMLGATNLNRKDVVLEIGPGPGILTKNLLKIAERVVAVEKDPKMVEVLKNILKGFENVKIIKGDILKTQPEDFNLKPKKYKIIANLPFYITSPIIRKFLEADTPPKEMVLIVQKEVAQRICAKPKKMNLLAVSVQFYAKPKIISYVRKESFWPKPAVDAAILKISPLKQKLSPILNKRFFELVRAGFSQPRKQLANNLSRELKLSKEQVKLWLFKNHINPHQRAESLDMKNWLGLVKQSIGIY